MESRDRKQWWENSDWVKVDDVTYQLKKDVERSMGQVDATSLEFFLSLVKAASQRGQGES